MRRSTLHLTWTALCLLATPALTSCFDVPSNAPPAKTTDMIDGADRTSGVASG